jgi:hypothetical protein
MEGIGGLSAELSQVPSTLHGQLFLLAFDPKQGRFDGHNPTLFGFALRAAMLSDLYLRGYLVERRGRAVPAKAASPDDPVLRAAFAQVGVHNRATWAQLVAGNAQEAISVVRERLLTEGWLRTGRNKVLAVPAASLEPYDECRVGALVDEASRALRNAIAGFSAEPWSLATGLLAVLAEFPSIADVVDARDLGRLAEVTRDAIAPVSGFAEAIALHHEDVRARLAGGSP